MTQPTTQVQLDTGHEFYGWFWYAQDTGLYDARNNAMLAKTGSAGMSTEGGANVVRGDGSTSYALASTVTLAQPFTINFRGRVDTGSAQKGMLFGDNTGSANYAWLQAGANSLTFKSNNGGPVVAAADVTVMHTWTITYDGAVMTIYKDAVSAGVLSNNSVTPFTLKSILNGYTGTTYAAIGSLEFLHAMPICATPAQVASLVANPYQALQAAGGTDGTAPGGTGTSTGSGSGGAATGGAGSTGTITIPAIKDLTTGALRSSQTGITVIVNDLTTGALVVKKTAQTTDASGNCAVTDALLVAATTYRVTTILADGSEGTWKYAAA